MNKGEIWLIDILGGIGHEQQGSRPAIVMSHNFGVAVAIPITSSPNRIGMKFTCTIRPCAENGLPAISSALVFQLKSLDERHFIRKFGRISSEDMSAIDDALRAMLKI